ncbi:MAG: hypothetical protein ACTSVM_02695 [Candidatus Ranarchaeia archaeon]
MYDVTLLEKYAKYPWSHSANNYIKSQHIPSLTSPEYQSLVSRGFTRVLEAIDNVEERISPISNIYEECMSYPIARMFIAAVNDDALHHRFAIRESKRALYFLMHEDQGVVLELVRSTFGWAVKTDRLVINNRVFDMSIAFQDYIQVAPFFQDPTWKMINRDVKSGWVYLDVRQFKRLIAEAVKRHVLRKPKVEARILRNLENMFREQLETIRRRWQTVRSRWGGGEITGEVWVEGFPPCIRELLAFTREGQNISHLGRFTLATFLLHVGLSVDGIVDLFRKAPDFQQDLARYQVRHISGEIGSGTKYTPPSCATLQTHHLCRAGDDKICHWVKHPLSYYRKKIRFRSSTKKERSKNAQGVSPKGSSKSEKTIEQRRALN